jgi:hypothetical protein
VLNRTERQSERISSFLLGVVHALSPSQKRLSFHTNRVRNFLDVCPEQKPAQERPAGISKLL